MNTQDLGFWGNYFLIFKIINWGAVCAGLTLTAITFFVVYVFWWILNRYMN